MSELKNTAVLMVKYGAKKMGRDCEKVLVANTPDEADICVIDNTKGNLPIAQVWNDAVASMAPNITRFAIVHADTLVPPGWLEKLCEIHDTGDLIGAVGPTTDNGMTQQVHDDPASLPPHLPLTRLGSFCILIDRKAFDLIGGFREDTPFYAVDHDFCARLRRFGFQLLWRTDVVVEHGNGKSVEWAIKWEHIKQTEKEMMDEALDWYNKMGVAIPAVLSIIYDFVTNDSRIVLRANDERTLHDAFLRCKLGFGSAIVAEQDIEEVELENRVLIWHGECLPLMEHFFEGDSKLYRWAFIFEDAKSYEERGISQLLNSHWNYVHEETLEGQRLAICASRRQTVCLSMIAKDEGDTIEHAIQSFPWDHVIVGLDNQTTDDTEEVCAANGVSDFWRYDFMTLAKMQELKAAGVTSRDWDKHTGFAFLRNLSLDRAKAYDWVMVLDGHEFITPDSARFLEHVLAFESPRVEAAFVNVIHGKSNFNHTRLMRPNSEIRWYDVVHNDLNGLGAHNVSNAGAVKVIHDRPTRRTEQRTGQVADMNTFFFETRLEEEPENSRALFYLASAYMQSERKDEGLELWQRYADLPDTAVGVVQHNPKKYQALITLANVEMKNGKFADCWQHCMDAWRYDPTRCEHISLLGDLAAQTGDRHAAIHWYNIASHYHKPVSTMFLWEAAYSVRPLLAMAQQYVHVRQFASALATLDAALKREPENAEAIKMLRGVRKLIHRAKGLALRSDDEKAAARSMIEGRKLEV